MVRPRESNRRPLALHSHALPTELTLPRLKLAWKNSRLCDANTVFPTKWRLRKERRISILVTCYYPDLVMLLICWSKFASRHDQSEAILRSQPTIPLITLTKGWRSKYHLLNLNLPWWHTGELYTLSVDLEGGMWIQSLVRAMSFHPRAWGKNETFPRSERHSFRHTCNLSMAWHFCFTVHKVTEQYYGYKPGPPFTCKHTTTLLQKL